MAHFFGSIRGSRGRETRCGTQSSGLQVEAAGWHFGVKVNMFVNNEGEDSAEVWLTGGSNAKSAPRLLGVFRLSDLQAPPIVIRTDPSLDGLAEETAALLAKEV
jgi:hypothetical protein